ncbi:hypothetical protein HGA34_01565 [Candidatus Falkowbacteria bacterium]|nr:hypothetical protein [Candidatus Falkowbacteria bacterium]
MNYLSSLKAKIKSIVSLLLIVSVVAQGVVLTANAADAVPLPTKPGANMIKGGSFETDLYTSWGVWQTAATRQYTLFRSYEPAFGQGSYAAGVEVSGAAGNRASAGLVGSKSNSFLMEAGKQYWLRYYAKASVPSKLSVYLENSSTYVPRTPLFEQSVGTDYNEYSQIVVPEITASEPGLLVFAFGDIASGTTMFIDGVSLVELSSKLATSEVRGSIGDTRKALQFNNLSYLTENDIEVELPYYNPTSGQPERKKFRIDSMTGAVAYFSFYQQTFGGVGKVYIKGQLAGQFNYNVVPKIIELIPSMLEADQDATIRVTGFSPATDASFVVVRVTDKTGKQWDNWLKPIRFDSQLNYVTVKLPTGVVAGSMFMQTSFQNVAGKSTENRTAAVAYKVKPVIYKMVWSQRGYDQVGDKLLIYGKGIANRPVVTYWNSQGKAIGTETAKVVDIFEKDELIEVKALKNANSATVTVTVNGVVSDKGQALSYSAKPRLKTIAAKNSRFSTETAERLPAAAIGETITLTAEGVNPDASSSTAIEFQGYGQRVAAPVLKNANGVISVVVPNSAQTGFVAIVMNGQKSNYLPLEIIPKIVNVTPEPVQPGQPMLITAYGVGSNINLAKVIFTLTTSEKVEVTPSSLTVGANGTVVSLTAPMAISNKYSSVNLRYDRWQDDGKVSLSVRPTVTDAQIDLNTGILTIRGYGFSINPRENVITYKYADQNHTVINPKVQMIGVYPTVDGQEIRVKILDTYHYGYVSVRVGDYTSNESDFGPVSIRKVVRSVEFVKELNQVTGAVYIYGYNFGTEGGVRVGSTWANVIYRSEFYIVATIDQNLLNSGPVIVTKP